MIMTIEDRSNIVDLILAHLEMGNSKVGIKNAVRMRIELTNLEFNKLYTEACNISD